MNEEEKLVFGLGICVSRLECNNTMEKWSKELPEDLLIEILNRCAPPDIIRLGSVCKSWLLVSRKITAHRQLPWLMMFSNPEEEQEARSYFCLLDNTTFSIKLPEICGKHCCGSFSNSNGWLMTVAESLEIQLFHPWRGIQLQLPHGSSFPPHPPHLNLLPISNTEGMKKISKAAMSDDGTTVAVIYDGLSLAFCRIWDKVWIKIKSPRSPNGCVPYFLSMALTDVIYHRGNFYAMFANCMLGVCHIDTATPYVEIVTNVLRIKAGLIYLVGDSATGSLFIVVRILYLGYDGFGSYRTMKFQVYEIGLEETGEYWKNPREVESLGDRVMFIDEISSMLVRASEFPGFKGNRIYFSDGLSRNKSLDMGVFNMEDRTVEVLFPNRAHPIFSPPIWITPPVIVESMEIKSIFRKGIERYVWIRYFQEMGKVALTWWPEHVSCKSVSWAVFLVLIFSLKSTISGRSHRNL